MSILRIPLPFPLSHDGIEFVIGEVSDSKRIPDHVVAAIGSALFELLSADDFENFPPVDGSAHENSKWKLAGRLQSVDRWPRK